MALTKRKKKRIRRFILLVLLVVFGIAVILLLPVVFRLDSLKKSAAQTIAKTTADTFRSTQTTVAYDTNGDVLMTMRSAKDMYYVEYADIPQGIIDAFVVTEDRKFFSHNGIDLKSIVRAMKVNSESDEIEQGASTITQQLVKNMFLSQEVSWNRKITEIFMALEMEKKYSKEQILEFYLNNIYFANGCYGVESAARGYFNKGIGELDYSQLAFLAAIPNNPTKYDPFENMDNTLERRDLVLRQMYEADMINTVNYSDAIQEEIELDPQKSGYDDYVDTYVRRCATEAMMESLGFQFQTNFESDEAYDDYCERYDVYYGMAQRKLFGGGYLIYTSIDPKLQNRLQAVIDQDLSGFSEVNDEGVYALQAASTCIDNSNGYVVAVVGGRSQEHDGYTLNRAWQSYRQPGSTIKPLNVYLPFLQLGNSPDTIVNDEQISGGPVNADGIYSGEMTLREAVRVSKNTVAWSIYQQITPKAGTSYLLRLGFRKVYVDKERLTGSIGGFTYGVTTEEMAGGYAAIENDGIYRKPTCVMSITMLDGSTVVDNSDRGTQIYQKNASRMMTDMLTTVVKEGTGKTADIDNAIVAGKTGTTNDNKDSWFVGYSRYYTTSVWVGYDIPRTLGTAVNYNKYIWHDYMEAIHENLPILDFGAYEDEASNTGTRTETQTESTGSTVAASTKAQESLGDRDADVSGLGDRDGTAGAGGDAAGSRADVANNGTAGQNGVGVYGGDRDAATWDGEKQDATIPESKGAAGGWR